MHDAVIDAFPRRPITLADTAKNATSRRLWLIGAILLLLPVAYVGYSAWQRTSLRADLVARGVDADVMRAEGSCLSRRSVSGSEPRGCTYSITYQLREEEGGGTREGSIYVPGAGPRVFAPPARYDPQNPDRIMSVADIERGEPIMNVAVPIVLFGLFSGLCFLVWHAMGNKALTAAAATPQPVLVPIRRAAVRDKTNVLEVWFGRPDGSEGKQGFAGSRPLTVGSAPDHALALLGPGNRPILLRHDLAELRLTEAERAAILQAAQG